MSMKTYSKRSRSKEQLIERAQILKIVSPYGQSMLNSLHSLKNFKVRL